MTLSLMMTATMLASCGSGYDGSESRKSGSYNNERTTAENYRYSNVTAGDTDGTANIGGGYNTEEYNHLTENGYKLVSDEPFSTFSTIPTWSGTPSCGAQSKKMSIPGTGSVKPSSQRPRCWNHCIPKTQPENLG